MLQTVQSFFENILLHVRAADVVDVVLIAGLLYAVFAWLKHRVSRVVGFGIITVAGVYGLAQVLDLYLTSMVFQVGLTAIAIALVIVFQEDIRRLFERLRTMSLWEAGGRTSHRVDAEALAGAIERLAQRRVGALVVLPGRESLDVHLHGGVVARARFSAPLLASIFDPETDGHDGAVILADGRIERFGVHLPLSTNPSKLGAGGTRHAAALGLAERCDAFVIVVSEERGVVSVAREGELVEMGSTVELVAEIDEFESSDTREARTTRVPRWLTRNVGLKFAALSVATLLWVGFALRVETVQRTYEVPIEYRGLSDTWYLQDPKPSKTRVELTGSERAFDTIEDSELKISLDMKDIDEGPMQLTLGDEHLNEPTGVSVTAFEPRTLRLKAHKLAERELPIEAKLEGKMPDGYRIDKITVDPGRVSLHIPRFLDEYLTELSTEPIPVDALRESKSVDVNLIMPEHARVNGDEPPKINVKLKVVEEPQPVVRPGG
ncbi:MAG: diadenylate cyclase [Persicimonas sp.]